MDSVSSLILRFRKGGGSWQSMPAGEGNLLIGRSSRCDLQLSGGRISRKHAELRIRGGQVWIVDLGSSNGTKVNGVLLPGNIPQPLNIGGKIEIGDFTLVLERSGGAPGRRTPVPSRGRAPGHVFISYSRQNTELVYPLTDKLVQSGINIWIDKQDIRPGRPWRGEIVRGIETADVFILFLSPHSAASENVRKELAIAIGAKVFVIPVILQPVQIPVELKYQLVELQYIDFFENPRLGFSQLNKTVHERQQYLALQPERERPDYLQAELVIASENLNEYYQEKQQRLLNFLAQAINISSTEMSIASLAPGSVRVIVNMPAAAAYELKAQALNGNPALLAAGISTLRFVGDAQFIQVGGAGPPVAGPPGDPPVSPTPPPASTGLGLKLLLVLGAAAIIITAIIALTITEINIPIVTDEAVISSPTNTPQPRTPPTQTITTPPTNTPTHQITSTPTSTSTRTPTTPPTETEVLCPPILTVEKNAHCREGPGTVYDITTSLETGVSAQIIAQNKNMSIKWWKIQHPNGYTQCWISDVLVSIQGDRSCPPVVPDPPTPVPPTDTPTPTPEDNTPPLAPVLLQPPDLDSIYCAYSTIDFSWSAVTDPSGIIRYEWELEEAVSYSNYTSYKSTSTTSTSHTETVDCNDYRWRVRAVDGAGNIGLYSDYFYFDRY